MGRHLAPGRPAAGRPAGTSRTPRPGSAAGSHRATRARGRGWRGRGGTVGAGVLVAAGAVLAAVALQPQPAATASAADRPVARVATAPPVAAPPAALPAPAAAVDAAAVDAAAVDAAAVDAAAVAVPAPAQVGAAAPGPVPEPTEVLVPALHVDSPLVHLGVRADGALEVPQDYGTAGWFAPGVAPGGQGPAVIAGHLDSRAGPGVFAGLARLHAGDQVQVRRADGSTVSFVVTGTQLVAKTAFPTDAVYGPVAGPELRLITCGGAFDHRTGHYVDNVIVFAREA